MPIEFTVLSSEPAPKRAGMRVTGLVADAILVTGMVAVGAGRKGTVQEIETLPDDEHGSVFRLTFNYAESGEPDGWIDAWSPGTVLSLAY